MRIDHWMLGAAMLAAVAAAGAEKLDKEYGVNVHVMWEYQEVPDEFRMLKEAGIPMVRADYSWSHQERQPGQWNWGRHDAGLEQAKKNGLTLLPILGYAPKWQEPAHEKLDAWLASCEKNLDRYGKEMKFWEVWNEHNLAMFWKNPNPGHYLKLLKPTFDLIRRKAPDAKVVLGGTSEIPIPYLETFFKAGGTAYFDVMNVHPYNWYDIPEAALERQLAELNALMKKYNVDKEVWITEIGWPTIGRGFMKTFLTGAFKAAGIRTAGLTLAVLDDNEMPLVSSSPGLDFRAFFPNLKGIRSVTCAELASLDPAEYPVLIAGPDNTFSARPADFEALRNYVKNGGIAVFPRGIPFYTAWRQEPDGTWKRSWADKSWRERLHLDFDGWWLDRSRPFPRGFSGVVAAGQEQAFPRYREKAGSNCVLSGRNLKGNDKMIPLIEGIGKDADGREYRLPLAAYYRFDSDLKGGVIANTFNYVGMGPSSEDLQARLLPRTILAAFKHGVKKVFWYELQAMENNNSDPEHFFGILHADLAPKPAWEAYKTLVRMRPAGSTVPVFRTEKGGVRIAEWVKPDGGTGCALWVTGAALKAKVKLQGAVKSACDYLGQAVPVAVAEDGTAELAVSSGVLYLDGPASVSVLDTTKNN